MKRRNDNKADLIHAQVEEIKRRKQDQLQNFARCKVLEGLKASFDATQNPLFVFGAWEVSRRHKTELPDWAAEAFDRMALNLKALTHQPPKRDIAMAAGRALGFVSRAKGGNEFAQIAEAKHNERILCAYLALRARSIPPSAVFQRIADGEFGLSRLGSANTVRTRFEVRLKQIRLSAEEFESLHTTDYGQMLLAVIAPGWDKEPYTQNSPDHSD